MDSKQLAKQIIDRERIIRETPPDVLALIPKCQRAFELMIEYGFDPNEVIERMIANLEQCIKDKAANGQ